MLYHILLLLLISGIQQSKGLQFDELETIIDQIVAHPNECDYEPEIHEIVPLADCQDSICSFPKSVCRYNLDADTWGCWKIPGECLKAIGDPVDDTGAIDPVDEDDYPEDDYFEDGFVTSRTPSQDLPTTEPITAAIEPVTTTLKPAPFPPPLRSTEAPVQIQQIEKDLLKSKQTHSRQKIKAIRESLKANVPTVSAKRKPPTKEGKRTLNRRRKDGRKGKRNKNNRKNSRRDPKKNNKNDKKNRKNKHRKFTRTSAKTKAARKLKLKRSKTSTKIRKQHLKDQKRKPKRKPKDWHMWCCYWAAKGDCDSRNPTFMRPVCQQSCGTHTCTFSKFDTCTVKRHPQCTNPTTVLARMGAESPPTRRPTAPKSVGKLKGGPPPRRSSSGKSSKKAKFLPVIKQTKSQLKLNNAKLPKKFRTFQVKSKDGKQTAFGKYLKRLSPFKRYKLMMRVKAYRVQSRRRKQKTKQSVKNPKKLSKLRRRALKKSALKRKAVRLASITKWRRKNPKRIRRFHRKLVTKVKTRARGRSRLRRLRAKRLRRLRALRRKKRIVVQ